MPDTITRPMRFLVLPAVSTVLLAATFGTVQAEEVGISFDPNCWGEVKINLTNTIWPNLYERIFFVEPFKRN